VNKKKQKNFVNLGLACTSLANVRSNLFYQKFFASFFQKRCILPLRQPVDFPNYRSEQNKNMAFG